MVERAFHHIDHEIAQRDKVIPATHCVEVHRIFATHSNVTGKYIRLLEFYVLSLMVKVLGAEPEINDLNFCNRLPL